MPACSFSRTRLTDHREPVPFSTIADIDICRDAQFLRKGNLMPLISEVRISSRPAIEAAAFLCEALSLLVLRACVPDLLERSP